MSASLVQSKIQKAFFNAEVTEGENTWERRQVIVSSFEGLIVSVGVMLLLDLDQPLVVYTIVFLFVAAVFSAVLSLVASIQTYYGWVLVLLFPLAIKLGLGFGGTSVDSVDGTFSYKIGAKYYINSMIPVQVDYSGASQGDFDSSFLGLQAGYAIFLGDMVSIEPGLRYNLGLGDSDGLNVLQFNVGFALHL